MAVPTITSVAPSSGLTKGKQLVKIVGTNFRIPPPPPAGYLGGRAQRTVSVKFGGYESPVANAISALAILARAPEFDGPWNSVFPLAQDVRVANLDDLGAEIPGENVTATGAYSINRPGLQPLSDNQRVVGTLIELLRRHVLENTWLSTHPDFDDNPADGLDEVARSKLPLLVLDGPSCSENRFYSLNRMDPEMDPDALPDGWMRSRFPVTVDMTFDLTGFASSQRELMSLGQSLVLFFRDVKWLKVIRNPTDLSKGTANYELVMPFDGQPKYESSPELDSLRSFGAVATIRGVDIDETEGIVVERGILLPQDPSVDSQEK